MTRPCGVPISLHTAPYLHLPYILTLSVRLQWPDKVMIRSAGEVDMCLQDRLICYFSDRVWKSEACASLLLVLSLTIQIPLSPHPVRDPERGREALVRARRLKVDNFFAHISRRRCVHSKSWYYKIKRYIYIIIRSALAPPKDLEDSGTPGWGENKYVLSVEVLMSKSIHTFLNSNASFSGWIDEARGIYESLLIT